MKLIDADNYYRLYCNLYDGNVPDGEMDRMSYVLQRSPTIDAVPVVHGRWVNEDFPDELADATDPAICSECKEMAHKAEHGYAILSKHCPNCGAKMDLEGRK